jgi:hypothetical protein
MKVAFIIARLTEFRVLGPVIDAALQAGWYVECWYDYGHPRVGLKGYLFPDVQAAPAFRYGQPVHRVHSGPAELSARLEHCAVDAIVSTRTVESDTAGAPPRKYPTWICVQAMLDTFANHTPEMLERCDLVALLTPWWTNWAASYYATADRPLDVIALRARLSSSVTHIGFPELDARPLVDRDGARRRWGIPLNQPVVVLLPFPQGVGQGSFWPRRIFGESSRLRRMCHVALAREYSYWRRALSDPSDADVVRAVRAFCDRNGAFLLVKSREKTPIPAHILAVADKCIYDESYYPPTVLEALSIASLCVSYYSASVLEAASVSVPNVCLTFSAEDYLLRGAAQIRSFERFFNRNKEGVFEFSGVSRTVTNDEAIDELPSRFLSDFTVDPAARLAYVRKFIGEDDCHAASRLLEAIAVTVKTMSTADGSPARVTYP